MDVLVFPPDVPGQDGRAEIDRIAVLIGARIDDRTAEYGHYTASRVFGPVEYRAVFIPPRTRAYHDARGSYSGNVIPGLGPGGMSDERCYLDSLPGAFLFGGTFGAS